MKWIKCILVYLLKKYTFGKWCYKRDTIQYDSKRCTLKEFIENLPYASNLNAQKYYETLEIREFNEVCNAWGV